MTLTLRGALTAGLLALALTTLGACASGARSTEMAVAAGAVAPVAPGAPGYHQIVVAGVQGGTETNPLWESEVSDHDFQVALENSLRAANYLADDPTTATMALTASLVQLKQPLVGLDMSVTSRVRYSAVGKDGKTTFDDTVAATGTGKFGDAIIGVERLRLANEASIRENIKSFLQRLGDALAGAKSP